MRIDDYQTLSMRTYRAGHEGNHQLGLLGETGEVADIVKKVIYHQRFSDEEARNKLLDELGDCLWYWVAMVTDYKLHVPQDFESSVVQFRDLVHVMSFPKRPSLEQMTKQLGIIAGKLVERGERFDEEPPKLLLWEYLREVWRISTTLGMDLDLIAAGNVTKLQRRYPDGFVKGGGIRLAEPSTDTGSDIPGGGAV